MNVSRRHEMERAAHGPSANDCLGGDGLVDICLGSREQPEANRPFRSGKILSLNRA